MCCTALLFGSNGSWYSLYAVIYMCVCVCVCVCVYIYIFIYIPQYRDAGRAQEINKKKTLGQPRTNKIFQLAILGTRVTGSSALASFILQTFPNASCNSLVRMSTTWALLSARNLHERQERPATAACDPRAAFWHSWRKNWEISWKWQWIVLVP